MRQRLPNSLAPAGAVILASWAAGLSCGYLHSPHVRQGSANSLLQNCDGRDKSELPEHACREHEQYYSMVQRSGRGPFSRLVVVYVRRQTYAKNQYKWALP
jgi:hypothetical protein